jgi:hypothetical protein
MIRLALTALASMFGAGLGLASPDTAAAQRNAAPSSPYKRVSTLVQRSAVVRQVDTRYIDPAMPSARPFIAGQTFPTIAPIFAERWVPPAGP